MYQDSNFNGESIVVLEGDDESMSSQWNDKLSSVRHVGSGCIKRDIDFYGNDIQSFSLPTLDSCIDKCSNYQGSQECKSVAYDQPNRGCYLKHTYNGHDLNYKVGVDSYNMDCEDHRKNNRIDECVHENYDFYSSDLPTIHNVANIYDCVAHCEGIDKCLAVAYAAAAKDCHPKFERLGKTPRPKPGVYSVEMECLRSC